LIGGEGEVGVGVRGESDDTEAEAFEQRHEAEDLVGLTAVAQQNGEIAFGAQAEIPVEGLRGIEETGGDAGAIEGGCDFLGDVGGLADTAENELSACDDGRLNGAGGGYEILVKAPGGRGEGVTFYTETAARTGEGGFRGDGHL
jgi:hypothetical protein